MTEQQEWLPTKEAGKLLGITARHVSRLKDLEFKKEGKNLSVSLASVEAYLRQHGHPEPENRLEEDVLEQSEMEESEDEDTGEDDPDVEENVPKTPDEEDEDFEDESVEDISDVRKTADEELPEPEDEDMAEADSDASRTELPLDFEEERQLQQNLSNLKETIEKRLEAEKQFVPFLRETLAQLETQYRSEKERNQKVQASLGRLLIELKIPFEENKPSLLKRLFGRR